MMVKEAIRILGAYDTNTGRTHCLCDNYYSTTLVAATTSNAGSFSCTSCHCSSVGSKNVMTEFWSARRQDSVRVTNRT